MENRISTKVATIMLFFVALVWGAGFMVTQVVLDVGFTPLELLTGRFFTGALILTIIFWQNVKNINRRDVLSGIIVGSFLASAFILQTYGQMHSTPSIAAFLTAVYVVIVPIIEWVFFKVRVDSYAVIGAVFTLIGIGFITVDSFNVGNGVLLGMFLIFLCAIGYALQIISVDKFTNGKNHISPTIISIMMLWFAFFITLFVTFFSNTITPHEIIFNKSFFIGVCGIIFLGLFSTAFAFLAQNLAQKKISPTKTSIILSLESVFGAMLSAIFLKEVFTYRIIVGFIIVFLGIIITETKPKILSKKKLKSI